MSNKTTQPAKLITAADSFDILESPFKNEKERIKYISQAYKNMSLAKAFSIYYGIELSPETKSNRAINTVTILEVGKFYTGTVKEMTKTYTTFEMPGSKEEIICRENLLSAGDFIQQYLLNHENKLLFYVKERKPGQAIVSVIDAYYRAWVTNVEKAITREDPITVHIDSLVKGGYVCHTSIDTLCELTGKTYTSAVFIPGSHIVLNIENDFEKWIGQDVQIVPQKFGEYRDVTTGLTERSLVGSRKRVLQIAGWQNLYEIYSTAQTMDKLADVAKTSTSKQVFDGTVTGIINSNKNTGIFIELDGKYITGLLPIDSSNLLDYQPGDHVSVVVKEFEVQEGKQAFVLNKHGKVVKCNTRPIFELA